jgi:HlyD family secretion protein
MAERAPDADRIVVPHRTARPEPPIAAPGWRLRVTRLARRPGLWLLLLVALAIGAAAALQMRGPVVPTAPAARRDLEQHLIASGRVRIVNHVALSAQTAGRVTAVTVREGDRVEAGQLLVQLDDREARAAVAQARAAVGAARARVDGLSQVDTVVSSEARREAETNLARAESALARLEQLAQAGAVASADVDDARRDVEVRRAQLAGATAQETAAQPDGAQTTAALNALREGEAALQGAETRLTLTRIAAPTTGIVLSRLVEPGDTAQPGTTLIELAGQADTQLVIQPDERNLAWVRLGQMALASADAFPEQRFTAEVCYIAPAVDVRRGSVEVRLCVPDPPDYLRPDMTVSVDLTVATRSQVITVPSVAVRDASTSAAWVWLVDEGRVRQRRVAVGIRGDGHSEITGGLQDGDEVVLDAGRALAEGERVRPAREPR